MKKILALLLTVIMVFSLSACSLLDSIIGDDIRGTQYADNTVADDTSDDASDETQAEEEKDFSVGKMSGAKYESEFLSIGCPLPENFSFYTDEEIKELNNTATDLAGEEYEKLMKESTLVYDMMASSKDQMSSLNIVLEKSNAATVAMFDLEKNGDTIAQSAKQSLESVGFTDVNYTVTTTEFLGKDAQCLKWDMKMGTEDYYEMQVFVKAFSYLATITVASDEISTCENILASFYEL